MLPKISLVRKLALQIVKQHNDTRSIKKRLFRAALSQDYLKKYYSMLKFDAVALILSKINTHKFEDYSIFVK